MNGKEGLVEREGFSSRDNMGDDANEERAQQIYEKSMKIEQQFGDVLTGRGGKGLKDD